MARLLRSIAFGSAAFILMATLVLAVVFIKCLVHGVPFNFSVAIPPVARGSISFGIVVTIIMFFALRPKEQSNRRETGSSGH